MQTLETKDSKDTKNDKNFDLAMSLSLEDSLKVINENSPLREKINFKIDKKIDLPDKSTVLTMKFDSDNNFLAVGTELGNTYILQTPEYTIANVISEFNENEKIPTSAVDFKKITVEPILTIGKINGDIKIFNVNKSKLLWQADKECLSQQLYSLDYDRTGKNLATSGSSTIIRIYEENRVYPIQTYSSHSNRVFSVKFHNSNPNLLVSGGWDETLFFYDLRSKYPFKSIYGPLICGNSLDFKDEIVLAGSWRNKNALQILDMRKFEFFSEKDNEDKFVYACQICKENKDFFAYAGDNQLKIGRYFEKKNEWNIKSEEIGGEDINKENSIFAMDFKNCQDDYIVIGQTNGICTALKKFS